MPDVDEIQVVRLQPVRQFTSAITGARFITRTVTSAYNVTVNDFEIVCDATSASFNVQLPAATGSGQLYHFKKIDATTNVVSILVNGSDNIDGSVMFALTAQWADVLLIDAATGYWDAVNQVTFQGLLPAGGTTGQKLQKLSNTDYDVGWV